MKYTDFLNNVARKVDTKGTQIGAADTRRVISEAFCELAQMGSVDASVVYARGMALARLKLEKEVL